MASFASTVFGISPKKCLLRTKIGNPYALSMSVHVLFPSHDAILCFPFKKKKNVFLNC